MITQSRHRYPTFGRKLVLYFRLLYVLLLTKKTELDPNFSVLLGEENKNKTCDPKALLKSGNSFTGTILATFFTIFGVAVLVALFIRFLFPRLKLAYQLRKHQPREYEGKGHVKRTSAASRRKSTRARVYEDDEGDINIERMGDMEVYTQVGKFVVKM